MKDSPQQDTTGKGLSRQSINLFMGCLVGCGIVFSVGGFWWSGFDFLKGVLLGFLIVLLNAIWTKKLVSSLLFGGSPKALSTGLFMLKFGLTAVVLYLAIMKFRIDPLAVLIGLSSLMGAAAVYSMVHRTN